MQQGHLGESKILAIAITPGKGSGSGRPFVPALVVDIANAPVDPAIDRPQRAARANPVALRQEFIPRPCLFADRNHARGFPLAHGRCGAADRQGYHPEEAGCGRPDRHRRLRWFARLRCSGGVHWGEGKRKAGSRHDKCLVRLAFLDVFRCGQGAGQGQDRGLRPGHKHRGTSEARACRCSQRRVSLRFLVLVHVDPVGMENASHGHVRQSDNLSARLAPGTACRISGGVGARQPKIATLCIPSSTCLPSAFQSRSRSDE